MKRTSGNADNLMHETAAVAAEQRTHGVALHRLCRALLWRHTRLLKHVRAVKIPSAVPVRTPLPPLSVLAMGSQLSGLQGGRIESSAVLRENAETAEGL